MNIYRKERQTKLQLIGWWHRLPEPFTKCEKSPRECFSKLHIWSLRIKKRKKKEEKSTVSTQWTQNNCVNNSSTVSWLVQQRIHRRIQWNVFLAFYRATPGLGSTGCFLLHWCQVHWEAAKEMRPWKSLTVRTAPKRNQLMHQWATAENIPNYLREHISSLVLVQVCSYRRLKRYGEE